MKVRAALCLSCLCAACSGSGDDALDRGLGSQRNDAGLEAGTAMDAGLSPDAASSSADDAQASSSDGSLDASVEDAAFDATADANPPDDAGDAASAADAEQADAGDSFDAGADCVAPSGASLQAQAVGLPASGLALWLRADRGVYLAANQAVCAWADARGAGPVLASEAQRPQFRGVGPQGWPALRFGASQPLSTAGTLGISATSPRTFVAVQTLGEASARIQAITQGQRGTPGTYLSIDTNTFNTAGSREGVYVTNNSYDSAAVTSLSTRVHVFQIDFEEGATVLPSLTYRINGQTRALTRNMGGLGDGSFESFGGADFTSVGLGLDPNSSADLSELLVYDHILSSQELEALENALFGRYFPE